ncbi:MAG: prepilin peptidase [Methylococcales bacterium]|jgi:leader peptidase (prepilin peptidase)/N-methyltransferase|nr:prepilin peptidase [Methylococcales bacterium]MBT7409091.1 prepilin peptidase [Methylococcales bacterium]
MNNFYALSILQESPLLFAIIASIFGLLVGSFLNVVIYRLPVMIENEWKENCAELNDENYQPSGKIFNLAVPRSRCQQCQSLITAWQNIPVISYLLLRGKCPNCQTNISIQYPIVELLTAITTFVVAYHYGYSIQSIAGIILTWSLISLMFIDLNTFYLPDNITLPFMWLGLILSLFNVFTDSQSSIIGACAGYLSLWSVYQLFKLLTKKEGMGYGDFKLLAMLGAWIGWQYLILIIILSSFVGAIFGISMMIIKNNNRNTPIPFGPYLAVAGWIALLWGNDIIQLYTDWAMPNRHFQ